MNYEILVAFFFSEWHLVVSSADNPFRKCTTAWYYAFFCLRPKIPPLPVISHLIWPAHKFACIIFSWAGGGKKTFFTDKLSLINQRHFWNVSGMSKLKFSGITYSEMSVRRPRRIFSTFVTDLSFLPLLLKLMVRYMLVWLGFNGRFLSCRNTRKVIWRRQHTWRENASKKEEKEETNL